MASLADSNRHQKIKQLFVEASALEPAKQRELLDRACAGDPGLRAEVESLLDCDSAAFSPLDALPAAVEALRSRLVVPPEPIPESIGGYRIIRKLGEGGMGVVYEAEQANPRRTVALKVIQKGVVSGSLLRRFEREAEVLGQLQHPGIAQIYEAGASDTVQPFFAMELVQGQPLLDYASSKGLGTRERLDLLARVTGSRIALTCSSPSGPKRPTCRSSRRASSSRCWRPRLPSTLISPCSRRPRPMSRSA